MFHLLHEHNGFESRFSASLKNIDAVCGFLERFLQRTNLSPLAFDMILGAREILNNAVIHGSQIDSTMNVHFSVYIRDLSIILQAADEGPGFNYQTLLTDCEEKNTCGRGMGILDNYFDTVLYRPPGNRVELQKNLEYFKNQGDISMSEIRIEGDLANIKLESDIISTTIDDLRTEFRQILKDGASRINLDLEKVSYIDSMGLGLLVATHNSLQKNDNRLQLSHVSDNILRLLKQMRLDAHFEIT